MAICSFFLKGRCNFGPNCRNEHPQGADKAAGPGFGNKIWTPSSPDNSPAALSAGFNHDSIIKDVTIERPLWPLSSYAPAKNEPCLVEHLDMSFEELRVQAVEALRNNQVQQYQQYELTKIQEAERAFSNLKNNVGDAFKEAYTRHKARMAKESQKNEPKGGGIFGANASFGGNNQSAFGSTSTPTSAFGTSNATSAFGSSAFGQSTSTSMFRPATANAFGTSTSTTQPQSAFGQSGFGSSAVGTSNQTNPTSTTAQPSSAFGSSGFGAFGAAGKPTPFGGSSAFGSANTGGAFGQSAFGTPKPNPTNAFGATTGSAFGSTTPAAPAPGSAFGAIAQQGSGSAFGSTTPASAFGSTAPQQQQTQSAFGQTSQPSAFGSTSSAFAPASTPQTNVFGVPATTNLATNNSPFGSGNAPSAQSTSAFGTANTVAPSGPIPIFGQPPTSAFGSQNPLQPQPGTAISSSFQPQPQSQPQPQPQSQVTFQPINSGSKGGLKPVATFEAKVDPYINLLPPNYLEILPPAIRSAFEADQFTEADGRYLIPDLPPPIELR